MSDARLPPAGYPASPSPLGSRLFESYVRRLAKRHFAGVHWSPPDTAGRWAPETPTIFVANHTNWWDGFLAFLVSRALGLRFQVLMEARHLQRYRVFLRLGALPMRRGHAAQAYADLEAALAYLGPGVGLWIFPQGERRPATEPLRRCESGAAHLAQRCGGPVRLCPVAFRYAYLGEQLPEAFVLLGEDWCHRPGEQTRRARQALTATIAARLGATMDVMDDLLSREELGGFEPLAKGRLSVNKRLDRFRHAVGLLGGRFEVRNG